MNAFAARRLTTRRWRDWTVGVTGMNALPDNPGPGVAVARCLRAHPGFAGSVVGLGYDAFDPGLHLGRVIDDAYLLPYPSAGEAALRDRLEQILAEHRLDAIVPCLDAELPTFIALEPWLAAQGVRTLLPTARQLNRRSKDSLPELCEEAGVATPACARVTSPAFFDTCGGSGWTYPLVVKGPFYDAVVAWTPEEAKAAFRRLVAAWGYPILVQAHVSGYEVNLTGIGDGEGNLIGPVGMRKRALTDKGKAWAGVSIRDEALEEMGRRLARALRWRGPFEVEALRGADGVLSLIEINPRFPAWVYLTEGAGVNLPTALLALLDGEGDLGLARAEQGRLFVRFADEVVLSMEEFEAVTMTGRAHRPPPGDAPAADLLRLVAGR